MKHIVLVFAVLPALAYSLVEEDDMPSSLYDCYSAGSASRSSNQVDVQTNCLQGYLQDLFGNATTLNQLLDQSALDWIDSLGQRIHTRAKRQTYKRYNSYSRYPPRDKRRVRREIRTLSDSQRQDFFDAVNALKNDKSKEPNKYDVFALMHQGAALNSAHGGPNFLGWHRYYLNLFEEALREKNRRVTLPYWASTLDYRMDKPEDSILWSEIFLGNGQGVVFKGPFANWQTPAQNTLLRRDIPGPDSSLIDPSKIINIYRKSYHREIVSPTAASNLDNLESHHDGVHRWVGGRDGHMGGLDTSPQDPVFFLHHCYIDYLWEKFRIRQARLGIDSEQDYPETSDPTQHPDRLMDNLSPAITNKEGYSDKYTRDIYRYAPEPTCRNRCGGSYNGFLYCDRRTYQCVSRSKRQFVEQNGLSHVDSPYLSQAAIGSTTGNAGTSRIGSFAAQTPLASSINPTSGFFAAADATSTSANSAPTIAQHFSSSIVDSRTNTAAGRKRRSAMDTTVSVFSHSTSENNKLVSFPIAISNMHDNKDSIITNSESFNISFQTTGFSYNGQYTDYISIDERTRFSLSRPTVFFQKPASGQTKAYVRVFDSFGNVCSPSCLVSGTKTYKDCTGVLKITPDSPLMYDDLEDGILQSNTQDPFMRFECNN